MLVLTADQRSSRTRDDLVPEAIAMVTELAGSRLAARVDRNAGDEIQLATEHGDAALAIALRLVRTGDWSVGIGAGAVEEPLPAEVRMGRGDAFIHARAAVERAKREQWRLAIEAEASESAADAEGLVWLLIELRAGRSEHGAALADLLEQGMTQKEAARRLGITESAVSLRAKAAGLRAEEAARPALARILDRLGAGA